MVMKLKKIQIVTFWTIFYYYVVIFSHLTGILGDFPKIAFWQQNGRC
jgi:hypothetical protein